MTFHYTVETDKSVEEAIKSLEESLKNNKFGVLWEFDVLSKLQEKGLEFTQPYRVLEVCNPVQAKRVITQNPLMGYFLPCKIVVYEKDGKTAIGLPRPTTLMDVVQDDELKDIAQEVEDSLIDAINQAK